MALEEALVLQPTEPKFMGAAGVAHAMTGNYERAAEWLDAVLAETAAIAEGTAELAEAHPEVAEEMVELHMYLAMALESTAVPSLAAPHYRRVLEPILTQPPPSTAGTRHAQQEQRQRHAVLRLAKLLQQEQQEQPEQQPEAELDQLWDTAVAHGLWTHTLQRPGYVVPGHRLASSPWWGPGFLSGEHGGTCDCGTVDESLCECEDGWGGPRCDEFIGWVPGGQGGSRSGRYVALRGAIALLEREAVALAAEFTANQVLT